MLIWLALVAVSVAEPASQEPSDVPPALRVTFLEAVERGLTHNNLADVARWEVERASALLRETRASALPTLTGNGAYTHLDGPRVSGPVVTAYENTLTGNLTLGLPLVAPQQWGRWSHARTAVDVASQSQADVRRSVAVGVAHAYLSVITQGRIVEVSQQAVQTAHQHFEYSQARFKGGVGNHLDELRADQEWASAEAQLQNAFTARTRSREALGIIIGADAPCDVADDMQLGATPDAAESIRDVESTRADLRLAKGRVDLAHEIRSDSWLDYMPTLLGVAEGLLQRPPTAPFPSPAWQVQLILSVPFYDGGLRYGQRDERDALASEAQIVLDYGLRQARSEVRLGFETLRHAENALTVAQRGAQKAREALQLANVAYRTGTTSNLEVIDAERTSRDADIAAIVADDAVRQARVDLLTAAGAFP